jgi:hypothetical protein
MKSGLKHFRCLSFWKRNAMSVEAIDSLSITSKDRGYELSIHSGNKEKIRKISKEELESLLKTLLDEYDILKSDKEYKAYLYEDDKEDFSLKFFLSLTMEDYTYIAIKGIHPFKQPHYQDFLNLFKKYFEEI